VPFIVQHAKHKRRIILLSVASLDLPYFPLCITKGKNLRKSISNIKCGLWFSSQILSETFFILRRTERDMIINVYRSSCSRVTWTKEMHYFLVIYFNIKDLHVSSRLTARHQEDQLCMNSNWYSQHSAWLYQLLFIEIWSFWWRAARLLEICKGLIVEIN
jgi:hypothetical protein